MDTSANDIVFNSVGHCNYCEETLASMALCNGGNTTDLAGFDRLCEQIKRDGKGKSYDCILGVSGGLDSSYALLLVKDAGLRPLAVHLDNGWNSELANDNIVRLINALGVDLHTHVIDWQENRDLQRSMIAAHVVDIEMLMDNAMRALNFSQAAKYGVRYLTGGLNLATEGMHIPPEWSHYKNDVKNIQAIHRKFGSVPIKTHPLMNTLKHIWYNKVKGIHWVSVLDYFEYNKETVKAELKERCGYRPYPYKHYESIFTRFYQGYILPQKFGVDKRKMHLSTLICSGQMSREEALHLLESDPYPDPQQFAEDYDFVIKKLGYTAAEFDAYIKAPGIAHDFYPSEYPFAQLLSGLRKKWG